MSFRGRATQAKVQFIRHWRTLLCAAVGCFASVQLMKAPFMENAEFRSHEAYSAKFPLGKQDEIVLILYSADQFRELGLGGQDSIIPRNVQADLYKGLDFVRARAVAFDFEFLNNSTGGLDLKGSAAFRDALAAGSTNVTIPLPGYEVEPPLPAGVPAHRAFQFDDIRILPKEYEKTDHIRSSNIVALEDDQDGRVRVLPLMVWDIDRARWIPSLPLTLYCQIRNLDPLQDIRYSKDGRTVFVAKREFALGPENDYYLRFTDPSNFTRLPYASSVKLLRRATNGEQAAIEEARNLFRNKIVLVGTVVNDVVVTSHDSIPGTELAAHMLTTLLAYDSDRGVLHSRRINLTWVIIVSIGAAFLGSVRPWYKWLAGVIVLSGLILLAPYLGLAWHLGWFELVQPALGAAISLFLAILVLAFQGLKPPEPHAPEEATIMFLDIRNSTSLVNVMGIGVVTELISRVFKTLSHEVESFGGAVERSTGDGLMVVFRNSPLQNGASACMDAVMPLQKKISEISEWFAEKYGTTVSVGMGIESGVIHTVIVEGRGKEPSSVGEAVHMAARLQEAARDLSVNVLVGPFTYSLTKHRFEFVSVGEVEAKGFGKTLAYVPKDLAPQGTGVK